ncbi:MAG: hypothetical protein CSA95_01475 [Bacteroidetes bacterium]|nr:MAG: hypothetical protein CSA95_01475 [Bacteroidota bacterium]
MFKRIPRNIRLLISLLLSATILFLIYRNMDIPQIAGVIRRVDPMLFLLFLLLFIPQLFIASLRWNLMTLHIGKVKSPLISSWHQVIGSYSANLIIPGKMGEIVRLPWMQKYQTHCPVLILVFMEKLLDIFSVVLLMMGAWVYVCAHTGTNTSAHNGGLLLGLVMMTAMVLTFIFRKRTFSLIARLFPKWVGRQKEESIYVRIKQSLEYLKDELLPFIALSVGLWFVQLLEFYVIFRMFGVDPGLFEVMFGCSLALLAGAIPISVAGVGPRDAVIISYFSNWAGNETLAAIGIITILRIVIPALLGLPSFFLQSKQ